MLTQQFTRIIKLIKDTRQNILKTVNSQLIDLYWNRGQYINDRISSTEWGQAVVKQGLIAQMKNLILELGKLFYHRGLQCLVAFELKKDKFKPGHLGQLNFYLEALDRNVKKYRENPSIGILLCKDKDDEVAEYTLSRSLSPTMVSEYQLQLPDKKKLE